MTMLFHLNRRQVLFAGSALVAISMTLPTGRQALAQETTGTINPPIGTIEQVAAFHDIAPSNATISKDGRIFATVHGQRRGPVNVIEITGKDAEGRATWKPFPNAAWNGKPGSGDDVFNTANGIVVDSKNRLWVLDHGLWLPEKHAARLFAFDINTGDVVFRHSFDPSVIPVGNLAQDLVVDAERGFVYVADGSGANPGLIVLNLATNEARAFRDHASLKAENIDAVIDSEVLKFRRPDGTFPPARLAINPISLTADGETITFGALNATSLYSVPARLFRDKRPDGEIASAIVRTATKPISNGMTTDAQGNHFISNLPDNGIDRIGVDGKLTPLVRDMRFSFPDSIRGGNDGWLYVLNTQLHKAPIFTGKDEAAKPPYLLMRVYTGGEKQVGR
jgi:sugar lactone lactonase YvrE